MLKILERKIFVFAYSHIVLQKAPEVLICWQRLEEARRQHEERQRLEEVRRQHEEEQKRRELEEAEKRRWAEEEEKKRLHEEQRRKEEEKKRLEEVRWQEDKRKQEELRYGCHLLLQNYYLYLIMISIHFAM